MLKKIVVLTLIYFSSAHATMKLISPIFSNNEPIPMQYTCDGENISPPLAWSGAPDGTQSFALVVDDPSFAKASDSAEATSDTTAGKPDAKEKTWTHWIVFNIPLTVEYIIENQGGTGEEVAFLQGKTDFDTQKWGGPCPPSGTHHYHFTLYALDTMLDLPAGATKQELLSAMHGHILEKTTLVGTYQRKK